MVDILTINLLLKALFTQYTPTMDAHQILQTIIITAVIGFVSSTVSTFVTFLGTCLCGLFFHKLVITDTRRIAVLDHKFGNDGICSVREVGPNNPPSNGIHFLWGGKDNNLGGTIGIRIGESNRYIEVQYTLYCFGSRTHNAMQELLSGNSNEIMVKWVCKLDAYSKSVSTQRQKTPKTPYPWQRTVTTSIVDAYQRDNFMSVLLMGRPGIGKSRLAEFVAVQLRNQFGVEPMVVKGFDPTSPGLTLDSVMDSPTWTTPCIIVIDEYDIIVNHAENQLDGDKKTSLAKNRSSFLTLLDRINLMMHVILIATTNKAESEFDQAYIRDGRFNLRLKVDNIMATAEAVESPTTTHAKDE